MADEQNLETLFDIDGNSIAQDSIHALAIGPSLMKMMVIKHDPSTFKSTWVTPGVGDLLGMVLNSREFSYQMVPDSDRHFIAFTGAEARVGDVPYDSLTVEQKRKYDHWDAETEKSGCGGDRF